MPGISFHSHLSKTPLCIQNHHSEMCQPHAAVVATELVTVRVQSVKSAIGNPVDSLKQE